MSDKSSGFGDKLPRDPQNCVQERCDSDPALPNSRTAEATGFGRYEFFFDFIFQLAGNELVSAHQTSICLHVAEIFSILASVSDGRQYVRIRVFRFVCRHKFSAATH
jgi:hypothetical protein